jgi:hypothetical protein
MYVWYCAFPRVGFCRVTSPKLVCFITIGRTGKAESLGWLTHCSTPDSFGVVKLPALPDNL